MRIMPRLSQLSRSVADRVVLITGAASGMGRATAHLFADEGARVAVTDLDKERVDAVVEEIHAAGGHSAGWSLDVADLSRIHEVVSEVQTTLGDIDILVNNAGISVGATLSQSDEEYEPTWQRSMDVMLSSQTLSGAGGRALATELRHAISARSPTRSPERRMSTGDAIEGGRAAAFTRSPARSIGSGDSDHEVTPVTSLTGAHARQLAAELKEKLKEAEAGGPAERAAALARGQ